MVNVIIMQGLSSNFVNVVSKCSKLCSPTLSTPLPPEYFSHCTSCYRQCNLLGGKIDHCLK